MIEKETLMGDVFDNTEISSLFEPLKEEEISKKEEPQSVSLFEIKEEPVKEEVQNPELEIPSLFDEGKEPGEEESADDGQISYGKIVQTLLKEDETFQIYEGDDPENLEYTQEQFVDLFKQNVQLKGEQIAEAVLEQAISQLSPTMQKLVTGELKGIKIADIVKDLEDFQEIESLPENPTDEQKERIVKKYYDRLAKERGKDADWVSKKVEKIIDSEELDSEYEDAKDEIQKDLDKKQAEKEKQILKQKEEKEMFKKYHSHYVNEVLKEENIFGLKLAKAEKEQVANVLSSFLVRPTDNKEKLGLTALIDSFINNDNPKESYKKLVMMALAGIAPDKLVEKLNEQSQKKVTGDTVKTLKTISKSATHLEPEKKKTLPKKTGNIF